MPLVARGLLLALSILLLSLPAVVEPSLGTSRAFLLATILLTIVIFTLTLFWDRLSPPDTGEASDPRPKWVVEIVAAAAVWMVMTATAAWMRQILIFPHDPQRADMLVVIQLAIRRLLQGGDPYTIYHVPWEVPLPYGPVMWAPFIVPVLLHADVRFVSLAGAVFVPVLCAFAAVLSAAGRQFAGALAWLIVLLAIAVSPDLRNFIAVAHTPVYWPLLALLAWLVTRERWHGAAIACGLLIVARTTMLSIAPVLLIAVWYRRRSCLPGTLALLAAAVVIPFLPFAIWDWPALQYGLYGSYQAVMKGFVWVSTTWVQHTIGTTGPMLTRGWGGAVEAVQIAVMLAAYAGIAMAIRAGRRPLPWMALALFVFSMTTLWPVTYIYFDVVLLFVCAAVAEMSQPRTRIWTIWTAALAAAIVVVATVAWFTVPIDATIDAGTAGGRPYLYSGFSSDEREGDTTFAWINGTRGTLLIARRSRRDATIDLACEPNLPQAGSVQQLSASLNGTVIGTVTLTGGWQHVTLAAPGRAWQIGVNELTLFLSSAVSPRELGLSEDGRKLSLAVDRLTVRTP